MTSEHAVAETLRRRMLTEISSGDLAPGERLGSERELAEHYRVSRATLRQVLASLDEAGLVRRVPGRAGGTFINHHKVEHSLTSVVGVPAYLARQGYQAGTQVLSTQIEKGDPLTVRALQLADGDLVVRIRRLRLADGKPLSLESACFPAERVPGLLGQPLGGSLYELLETRYSITAAEAEEVVEVVHATDEEADVLSVASSAPLLSLTRTTFDPDGLPFEFSHDLFRSDRTRIVTRTPGRGLRASGEHESHFAKISLS